MYYDQLINHYADAMHVSVYGNKPNIVGLEKLGPVLHTIGDTIVPQHVRCTHGCLHDEWEHTVETLVLNGLVGLNVGLVRDLLLAEPFNKG
jgi:hypothetical protein